MNVTTAIEDFLTVCPQETRYCQIEVININHVFAGIIRYDTFRASKTKWQVIQYLTSEIGNVVEVIVQMDVVSTKVTGSSERSAVFVVLLWTMMTSTKKLLELNITVQYSEGKYTIFRHAI